MFQFDKFLFGDNKLENLFNIPKNNYKDYEIKTIGFSNYNLFIIFSFRRKFYYETTNKFKIKNFINVKKLNKLNFDDKEVIGGDVGKICKLALSNNINLKYKGMIIKKKINSRVLNHHFGKNKRSKKKKKNFKLPVSSFSVNSLFNQFELLYNNFDGTLYDLKKKENKLNYNFFIQKKNFGIK
jgi:hypothetical protein